MTDELDQIDREPPRSLLDHPQRFGILPTRWFWEQENPPAIRWGFALLAALTVLVTIVVVDSILVAGLIPPLVLLLANGLLEKYVRRQALKRRELAAAEATKALES